MITIKELIGQIVGNEPEPRVTVTSGNETIVGNVVNYGEDAILLMTTYEGAGITYTILPYANINSIYKYVPYKTIV